MPPLTKAQFQELEEAAKPLMEWMNKNCHPHVTAIVTSEDAELLEGQARVRRENYAESQDRDE